MNDLFDRRTAKEKVIDWVLGQRYVRTSDVMKAAIQNHWGNRAVRNIQDFAQHHSDKIRRLTQEEKERLFGNLTEDIWTTEFLNER